MEFYIVAMRAFAKIPALVSGILLMSLWRQAEIFGWRQVVFAAWFFVALMLQFFTPSGSLWLIGLLAQVALALVLVMKERINHMY